MIKIIGSLMIIIASSLVGFMFSCNLRKRANQLSELQNSLLQLQNEIMFTHTPLPEAFLKVAAKSKPPISELFSYVGDKLLSNSVDSVYDAFNSAFKVLDGYFNIKNEDIDLLMDLAKSLGGSDIQGHKKIFSLIDNNLTKRLEEANYQIVKNSKMYNYLGFSFGAVVVIMLI